MRAPLSALMFTVVLAVMVTPFAVAGAETTTPASDTPSPLTTDAPKNDSALAPTTTTVAPAPTTAPVASDDFDGDGVPNAVEDAAPNNGDGNHDGIPDSQQANVASLPAAIDVNGNGLLDDYVTLVAPDGTKLENVTARMVPTSPAPPADAHFTYGLFDYDVRVANPGDAANVTYILPDGPAPENFYVLQNGKWSDVTDHASIDASKNEVTVGLRDGGVGDASKTADGVIHDPSGPSSSVVAGTLTINKGGDRTAGTIAGAAGAVFSLYTDSNLTVPASPATCGPTDASGVCSVQLAPGTYYAKETTPPTGYNSLPQLATDVGGTGSGTNRNYTNTIGPLTITSGGTLTIPNNSGLSADDYNYNTGKYANSRVNPTLPAVCGLSVALLLDLSGSIDDTEFSQMKTAAKGFVDSLTGTPSSVGVYTFATSAPASGNTNLAATSVSTAAGGTTVKTKIDGLNQPSAPAFYTNWDAGFRQIPTGYDLVMILTDGNPTVDGIGSVDTSNITTNFFRIEAGIASANSVKTLAGAHGNNTRILGIGIGIGANSEKNLAAVSGPTAYNGIVGPGSNAATADSFVAGFDTLGTTLGEIAKAQCAGSVTATKQIKTGPGANDWALAPGWQFGVSPAADTSNPANGQTDANGAVSFTYSSGSWPKTVQVFETLQAGYSISQQSSLNALCTLNGGSFSGGAVTDVNVPDAAHPGVQFQLNQLDTVSCNFRNTPGANITVNKVWSGGASGELPTVDL
ncbi:MAG: choice-of-anchor U domain-containing protein, partial [Acidimicrobiia bacterium]